jgi:putative zinc finger protein
MNCAELETLICDYVDGTIASAQKADVESHLHQCPACAELARDSAAAVAFMDRAAAVEPPPELITRILFDAPWNEGKWSGGKAKPKRASGWFSSILGPLLQPKFAMSMAFTILSLSMLARFVTPVRQLRTADLKPSEVWASLDNRAHRAWARSVKYYENLKVVYQIQTLWREWQQQEEEQRPAAGSENQKPDQKIDDRKLPIKASPGQGAEPDLKSPDGAPISNPSGGSR